LKLHKLLLRICAAQPFRATSARPEYLLKERKNWRYDRHGRRIPTSKITSQDVAQA